MIRKILLLFFLHFFITTICPQNETDISKWNIYLSKEELKDLSFLKKEKQQKTDFSKILGAHKCGHCHGRAFDVWKKTLHFTTFSELPKYKNAKKIKEKLKIKGSIKRNELCRNCHFLQQKQVTKDITIISGVSCESCHGPSKDWLDVHNDYGKYTQETESFSQKESRRKLSIQKGLKSPFDIYTIAESCYKCHTVPNEDLINNGGHKPGSDFELVSWTQGTIRHNFMRGRHGVNEFSSLPRLRVMFVVGIALDLEYALRGLASSQQTGIYRNKMKERATMAYKKLIAICKLKPIKQLKEIILILRTINLSEQNATKIKFAADLIALKNQQFSRFYDGENLQVLDNYLPKKSQYFWQPSTRKK